MNDLSLNNIYIECHNFTGEYAGFDESQPTCEDGGKPRVMHALKQKFGYQHLVHVGDGATDMEASPPAVSLTIFLI